MRKLIDAARSAVADLQAAAPPPAPEPSPVYEAPPAAAYAAVPPPAVVFPASPAVGQAPIAAPSIPTAPMPAVPYYPAPGPGSAESAAQAAQALQAATAMARATTELGRIAAAASSGFIANAGMLPTVQVESHGGAGVSRRLKAVIETIVSQKNLNLRLASPITQVFEGAELKASDYAKPNNLSKDSAGRELRQAAEGTRREGLAVIRANPLGQPIGTEQPPEDVLRGLEARPPRATCSRSCG